MSEKKLNTEFEKFSYALGMSVSGNLIKSGVNEMDPESFLMGVSDTFNGAMPKLQAEEANNILEKFINESIQKEAGKNLEAGMKFLAENKKKDSVIEMESGLQYKILKEGKGKIAGPTDTVRCHYHGTLIDGTVFDSSVQRGQPAEFPVNGVIKGWTEALQLMPVGSKWTLFVPPNLAYGQQGAGGVIGPNTTLIFDVELLEIV